MKLLAICFGAAQADKEHVLKVVTVAEPPSPVEIVDVRTSSVDLKDVGFVFIFGPKANLQVENQLAQQNIPSLLLPTVKQLYPVEQGGDELARQGAMADLIALRQMFKETKTELFNDKKLADSIKADCLPDFSIAKIQALEKAVKESGKNVWLCTTRDKKTLALTLDGKLELESVDITMTFSELIAMRAAMDILDVKEIKLVSR